jgi:type IV secretory pathway VirB6-like protein
MPRTPRAFLAMLIAALVLIIMPGQAFAYTVLNCDGSGGVEQDTELLYTDPAGLSFCAYNHLDASLNPDNRPAVEHIFSSVICNYVTILNTVLGTVYCALQYSLQDMVAIIITLYIMIFGVQILMGTTRLTSKEMLMRLGKLALVWTFISQSNYAVDLIFIFFIDAANMGLIWAMEALQGVSSYLSSGGNPRFTELDFTLPDIPNIGGISGVMPLYLYVDELIYTAVIGPFTEAKSELLTFFAVMSFIMPPLFGLAVYWLWATFSILVRTLIAFMMSISAVAFLICLSPIFLSMMLFTVTYQFFDQWLKYLTSFTLQVVIVFSCVALWIMAMSNFIGFFNQLSDVLFPYYKTTTTVDAATLNVGGETQGRGMFEDTAYGVCPYIVTAGIFGPEVACADTDFSTTPGPTVTVEQAIRNSTDERVGLIRLENLRQYSEFCDNTTCVDETPDDAIQHGLSRLSYFIIYHLIALTIVAYAFDALLKSAPLIAKDIAGPTHVPMLGQGYGATGVGTLKGVMKNKESTGSGLMDRARDAKNFITGEDNNNSASNVYTDRERERAGNR